jgi:hypothetical protein
MRKSRAPTNRKVVLIFGDPDSGKSYLAQQLHERYGYAYISLDEVYVRFVEERFPDLYLPAIRYVIAQHFQTMLQPCTRGAGEQAWAEHVASVVEAASSEQPLLAVEGFLLPPALTRVLSRLGGKAKVTVVQARSKQYFVASSLEEIHQR